MPVMLLSFFFNIKNTDEKKKCIRLSSERFGEREREKKRKEKKTHRKR
jgi:hypothetical protein